MLLAPGAANATGTPDQQQTETSSYYFVEGPQVSPFKSGFSLAQTFTAGLSGSLDQVELPLRRRAQTTLPVNIQITSVESGGAPNNAGVLASTTVPASEIPTSGTGFVAITFTVPPSVVAGTQYAIVAYTADPNEGAYEWGGSTPDPSTGNVYAAGEPWASINSPPGTWTAERERGFVFDLGFKTYVTRPSTTLTTTLSGGGQSGEKIASPTGVDVSDTATLSGEHAAEATGNATFHVYIDSACTEEVISAANPVTNGKARITFGTTRSGTYYWRVSYPGDAKNAPSESPCGAEVLTEAQAPTLATTLSGGGQSGETVTVKEGEGVTDQATLSGENASNAGGTVSYKVYSDNECSKEVTSAGEVEVSGGKVPASEAKTLAPGTYYWRASYSGDATHPASGSKCGTEVETVTASTATCGKTTVGKSSDALLSNLKRVNKCVLPNATVTELTTYLAPTSTKGQQLIKGIIYADSKGKPGARLGVTEQLTFKSTSAPGWYRLVFSTPVKVEAGTYWIGLITGTTSKVAGERYDAVKNAEDYNSNGYTSGPSNPFGSFKTTNEEMSLYATFTPERQCAPTRLAPCF